MNGNGFELSEELLANDKKELTKIIDENTTQRHRSLMNGGLCERIYSGAKSNLDQRTADSGEVSVTLHKQDVLAACKALPAPPEPEGDQEGTGGGGGGGGGGGDIPDGWVPKEFVEKERERGDLFQDRCKALEKEVEQTRAQLSAKDPGTAQALQLVSEGEEKRSALEREIGRLKDQERLQKAEIHSLEAKLKTAQEAPGVVGDPAATSVTMTGETDVSLVPELLPHPPTMEACCCLVTKPCVSYSCEATWHAITVCCAFSYETTVWVCTECAKCCKELSKNPNQVAPAQAGGGAASTAEPKEPVGEHIAQNAPARPGQRDAGGGYDVRNE